MPEEGLEARLLRIVGAALTLVDAAERARAVAEGEREVWRQAHDALVAQVSRRRIAGTERQQRQWTPERRARQSAAIRRAWQEGRYASDANGGPGDGSAGPDGQRHLGADLCDGQ